MYSQQLHFHPWIIILSTTNFLPQYGYYAEHLSFAHTGTRTMHSFPSPGLQLRMFPTPGRAAAFPRSPWEWFSVRPYYLRFTGLSATFKCLSVLQQHHTCTRRFFVHCPYNLPMLQRQQLLAHILQLHRATSPSCSQRTYRNKGTDIMWVQDTNIKFSS